MASQKIVEIEQITIHCSATMAGLDYDVEDVDRWHSTRFSKQNQSKMFCGYHFVILLDGTIQRGRYLTEVGAHSIPNKNKVGICYIGGLDKYGEPKDTRTQAQKNSMHNICMVLKEVLPKLKGIVGHRDNSEDLDNNGIIDPSEWAKSCPCFDAIPEFEYLFKNGI